jgi:hypothetical protein
MSGSNTTAYNGYLGTSNILAGIASLTINGEVFDVMESNYSPSNLQIETLVSLNGISGLKATPRAGFITATLRDAGNLSVATINAMRSANLVLVTAAGKTISGTGMWFAGEPSSVNVAEGTFEVRFEGTNVNEVTTSNQT